MWIEAIPRLRKAGKVRCRTVQGPDLHTNLGSVVQDLGLTWKGGSLEWVDPATASAILEAVLWKDLAYGLEVMPRDQARALSAEFVTAFASPSTRYYSNGLWHRYHDPARRGGFSWEPLTDGTFDAGIIAVGEDTAGCVWVEDED